MKKYLKPFRDWIIQVWNSQTGTNPFARHRPKIVIFWLSQNKQLQWWRTATEYVEVQSDWRACMSVSKKVHLNSLYTVLLASVSDVLPKCTRKYKKMKHLLQFVSKSYNLKPCHNMLDSPVFADSSHIQESALKHVCFGKSFFKNLNLAT